MSASLAVASAFVRRDWITARSYRATFAVELVAMLATTAMFFYISRLVDGSHIAGRHFSHGYFGFVVIGLAVMRVVHTSLSAFPSRVRSDQMTGSLEALMGAPAPTWLLLLASVAFDLLRALLFAATMIAAAVAFFGLRPDPGWLGAAALVVVVPACVALFASLGVVLAAFTVVYKQATGLVALLSAGLGLVSGIYFPLSVLPHPLAAVADALPFTWAVQLVRAAVLGNSVPAARVVELAVSSAVLLTLALVLFRAAIDRARRAGSLSHF